MIRIVGRILVRLCGCYAKYKQQDKHEHTHSHGPLVNALYRSTSLLANTATAPAERRVSQGKALC